MALMMAAALAAMATGDGRRHRLGTAAKPARGSLLGLFSTDDYPNYALRHGEQGTTAVRLTISPAGGVSRCVVDVSASPNLDRKTCAVITARATYNPARDARGRPMTGHDSARIRWVIPRDDDEAPYTAIPTILEYRDDLISSVVQIRNGLIDSCSAEVVHRTESEDVVQREARCATEKQDAIFYLSHRPAGLGQTFRIVHRRQQSIGAAGPVPAATGTTASTVTRATINPNGTVTRCERIMPSGMTMLGSIGVCGLSFNTAFAPLGPEVANAQDRFLTVVETIRFEPGGTTP